MKPATKLVRKFVKMELATGKYGPGDLVKIYNEKAVDGSSRVGIMFTERVDVKRLADKMREEAAWQFKSVRATDGWEKGKNSDTNGVYHYIRVVA
jgi:hypothetical protein